MNAAKIAGGYWACSLLSKVRVFDHRWTNMDPNRYRTDIYRNRLLNLIAPSFGRTKRWKVVVRPSYR